MDPNDILDLGQGELLIGGLDHYEFEHLAAILADLEQQQADSDGDILLDTTPDTQEARS